MTNAVHVRRGNRSLLHLQLQQPKTESPAESCCLLMARLKPETTFCCLSPCCVQVRHGGTIAQDIIRGLAYLHARGIVHGRLKTPNVLLNRAGVAKVADAALGSLLSHCKASSGTGGSGHSPGRPGAFTAWMAPEVPPPPPCRRSRAACAEQQDVLQTLVLPSGRTCPR